MRVKYYLDLVKGKTNALNPARIDGKHVWAVFQSWVRSILPTPKHIEEQVLWRRLEIQKKSPKCIEEGHCIYCGCFILGKTTADLGCEDEPKCYPDMMEKKEWSRFKIDNNIKLFE